MMIELLVTVFENGEGTTKYTVQLPTSLKLITGKRSPHTSCFLHKHIIYIANWSKRKRLLMFPSQTYNNQQTGVNVN